MMAKTTKRKCNKCGKEIVIYRDNIKDVVYYDAHYFHTSCLIESAKEKLQSKRNSVKKWQGVIDNIAQIEEDTKNMLRRQLFMIRDTDELNNYLLEHYNVTTIDSRFWQIIMDLGKGFYRKKRCKKVDIDTIYGAWVWGQAKLDEINRNNKIGNRGPTDDTSRLMYDLTIIVSKIPNYLAHKAKQEAMAIEEKKQNELPKINYNNFETKTTSNVIDDISDMLDEIF